MVYSSISIRLITSFLVCSIRKYVVTATVGAKDDGDVVGAAVGAFVGCACTH
jgi:hypothetical protein